jgi:hypothetical protein
VATPNVIPITGQMGNDEVGLRLRLGDDESSTIRITSVTENAAPKLCGMAVEESFVVRDQLARSSVNAVPTHIDDLQSVAHEAAASLGVTPLEDSPAVGQADSTATEGWTTAWKTGDFRGDRVSLYRYADRDDALAAAQRSIDQISADGVSTFAIPSASAAVGLRYLGSAWTWAQPADVGPQLDTAIMVHDDVVITVATSGLSPQDDHSELIRVVEAVMEATTG